MAAGFRYRPAAKLLPKNPAMPAKSRTGGNPLANLETFENGNRILFTAKPSFSWSQLYAALKV